MSAENEFDVVVIGGACAGASAALLLRRWRPRCRVLIIERQALFDRKVGEATVEVSAMFFYRVLGLYDHLAREQLPKHGLRYWLTDTPQRRLAEMSEIGSSDAPRQPSFQLDRAKLDQKILDLALDAGCELARPAKVTEIEHGWPRSRVRFSVDGAERSVATRWVVDASGRQAFIARRKKLLQSVARHPTAAAWARWQGVADMDGVQVQGADPHCPTLAAMHASRRLATNHFCGYGWWCWVIPLSGGQTSIGVVYNKTLFSFPGTGKIGERYQRFVTSQPGLRELLSNARMEPDDFHALGNLPYQSSRYMDRGWALIGDAASFMDPYYSPGLDHVAISTYATVKLIQDDLQGELEGPELGARIASHNQIFSRSYERWIGALYEDKYELMGDAELLKCAFLIDTSLYYLGMVGPISKDLNALANPPFGPLLPQATAAYRIMRFFNRRLLKLARYRRHAGVYGRRNANWRSYSRAFGIGRDAVGPLFKGCALWLRLELEFLFYRLRNGRVEVSQPVAKAPAATGLPLPGD